MTSEEIQRDIIRALRDDKLDYYQVAADIGQAPFRVRAELGALRRRRLVVSEFTATAVKWALTPRGVQLAWEVDQTSLG